MDHLSEFENIDKIGYRYMIQYFHTQGYTTTKIKAKLESALGQGAPSFTTIKYWVSEFKRGRTSCEDGQRSGRPNKLTTPDMAEKVYKIILEDPRLNMREIAERVGITKNAVHRILSMEEIPKQQNTADTSDPSESATESKTKSPVESKEKSKSGRVKKNQKIKSVSVKKTKGFKKASRKKKDLCMKTSEAVKMEDQEVKKRN